MYISYILVILYIKGADSRINCACAQLVLDSEQLIVFCNTLRSARSTGLDLAGVECYCKICNGSVCSLTGTMGRNRGITSFVSHLDCFQCLRYGTDLVQFDKDGISCTQFDTFCKSLGIGNEEIIANQLYFISQSCSEFLPAFPVFLIQTILENSYIY